MTAAPVSNGRNGRGQFVAGHAGGPGNPHVRRLGELQRAVREACTPGKLAEVLDALHVAAVGGDTAAAKVWLDRALGPAMQSLNVAIEEAAQPVAVGPKPPDLKQQCKDMLRAHQLAKDAWAMTAGDRPYQPRPEVTLAVGKVAAVLDRLDALDEAEAEAEEADRD